LINYYCVFLGKINSYEDWREMGNGKWEMGKMRDSSLPRTGHGGDEKAQGENDRAKEDEKPPLHLDLCLILIGEVANDRSARCRCSMRLWLANFS
jgi:hypothetical protein